MIRLTIPTSKPSLSLLPDRTPRPRIYVNVEALKAWLRSQSSDAGRPELVPDSYLKSA